MEEGRFVCHNKKGQYRESTSILTDIYHKLYRVTFRNLLEGYWGWGVGGLVGHNKKDQYKYTARYIPYTIQG